MRNSTWASNTQLYPWLHKKQHGQQFERGDSPLLLHFHDTPPGVQLCGPQYKDIPVGASLKEDPEDDQRAEAPPNRLLNSLPQDAAAETISVYQNVVEKQATEIVWDY